MPPPLTLKSTVAPYFLKIKSRLIRSLQTPCIPSKPLSVLSEYGLTGSNPYLLECPSTNGTEKDSEAQADLGVSVQVRVLQFVDHFHYSMPGPVPQCP
jgi:hypothetical protein